MLIHIVGGGPAGLYFAILMKKRRPKDRICVLERDGPSDTFGWGIVFSDKTLSYLKEEDEETHAAITSAFETWDNVDVVHRDRQITIRGNKFSGIERLAFLNILHARCEEVGVELRFRTNVAEADLDALASCDLLIGADGANSLVRRRHADHLQPSVDVRRNKYIWLGTNRLFHGLTLTFRENEAGAFVAHSYKFNKTTSTFIVECAEETWRRAGLHAMGGDEACRYLARVFESDLGGHPLLSNNFVKWLNFPIVRNRRWSHDNVVLLGDALHTAHFSIGSGTKLALEDAIALYKRFEEGRDVPTALSEFERVRKPVIDEYQEAAHASLIWFESAQEKMSLHPMALAYELMTRSRKIDQEGLRRRDPEFAAAYERWRTAGGSEPRA